MDLYEALYTTRAMRRVRPDPVPEAVVKLMLDAAIRAPSGGNTQQWRFMPVTARETVGALGDLYRDAYAQLHQTIYKGQRDKVAAEGDETSMRVFSSSDWLGENFGSVPLVVLVFSRNDPDGSSIYPAIWNMMLAARGEGVGATLTTVLGYFKHDEVLELLGVPADKGWRIAAAVTCGYPLGNWDVAQRSPVNEVVYSERWGQAPDWTLDEPIWSAD